MIRISRCATMSGCWASCSARRSGSVEGEALFALVEEVARAREARACRRPARVRTAGRSAEPICRLRRRSRSRGRSRSSSRWPTSPSSIIASAGAATTRATRHTAPSPVRAPTRSRAGAPAACRADALADAVRSLRIELVLTAHPTEMVRRTLLQTHRRIADVLAVRDRPDLTPEESDAAIDALRREIATVWQTDEVRDRAVSPLDEVRGGLAVFEQTLWEALPRYMRQIDRALGEPLPLDAAPLRFGSWIGGDRDGNPNVTPEITRRAAWMARWVAADLYSREIDALRAELSIGTASDELRAHRRRRARTLSRAAARRRGPSPRDARVCRGTDRATEDAAPAAAERPFLDVGEFAAPLLLCHRSLVATGNGADRRRPAHRHPSTRRRIRADAGPARPASGVGAACRGRWRGSRGAWNSGDTKTRPKSERVAMLIGEIDERHADVCRSPRRCRTPTPESVRDVLDTFRTAAALPRDSLGAYVITMASRASDVLAVELLQKLAGNRIRSAWCRCSKPPPISSAPARCWTRSWRCRGIARASRDTRR